MSLNAKEASGGGGFKQPSLDAGTYPARVVQVIDLGVQEQRPYQGKAKDPAQEISVTYEAADEFMVDEDGNEIEDKPRWFSERFVLHNLKADRAKSTQRYNAIDPDCEMDGDWSQLLGRPVNVVLTATEGKGKNKGRIFNNVASLSAMRVKEVKKLPELVNDTKVFSLDDPDIDVFMSLPEWLQGEIKKNLDFEGSLLETRIKNYKKPEDEDGEAQADDAAEEPEEDDGEW